MTKTAWVIALVAGFFGLRWLWSALKRNAGRAGSGRAGSGRAISGRASSGRAGSGRASSGRGGAGRVARGGSSTAHDSGWWFFNTSNGSDSRHDHHQHVAMPTDTTPNSSSSSDIGSSDMGVTILGVAEMAVGVTDHQASRLAIQS